MSVVASLFAGAFGPSQPVSAPDHWLIRAIGGTRTAAGVNVNQYTALHLPVVYAAIGVIADVIAMLPLKLYRRTERGAEEAREHPLWGLVHDAPNERMSAFIFRQTLQHHTLAWGNGYAEIEFDNRGQVAGLWPLLPDRTAVHVAREEWRITYRTTIDARSAELPADRVLHIPALGFDGVIGYAPLTLARQAIGWGLAMEEFGARFFANDARSGGFLKHPATLSEEARENLRNSFQAQGGLSAAHRVKILEEGMEFVPTSIPPDDAQFLGSREFQIAEIARMYRVPLVILQSHERSTAWGSGIEQMMIGFVVWTLQPWFTRWEQELNRKLLAPRDRAAGLFFKFNATALLRGDMRARSAFYRNAVGGPWMTPNEARALEEMDELDGGDALLPAAGAPAPDQADDRDRGPGEE